MYLQTTATECERKEKLQQSARVQQSANARKLQQGASNEKLQQSASENLQLSASEKKKRERQVCMDKMHIQKTRVRCHAIQT